MLFIAFPWLQFMFLQGKHNKILLEIWQKNLFFFFVSFSLTDPRLVSLSPDKSNCTVAKLLLWQATGFYFLLVLMIDAEFSEILTPWINFFCVASA